MRPVRYIILGILAASLQFGIHNEGFIEEVRQSHDYLTDAVTCFIDDMQSHWLQKKDGLTLTMDRTDPYMMGWEIQDEK